MAAPARSVFIAPGGRLRLGWRLLLYLALMASAYAALSSLLPRTLTGQAVVLLGSALLAGSLLLALDGRAPGALGFPVRREAVAESALGLLLGCVVGAAAVAPMAAAGVVRWSAQDGSLGLFFAVGLWTLAMYGPLAAGEEALLRGYPLQALSEGLGPAAAVLLTSGAFGLLHSWNPDADWVGVLNTGLAGVFLGALYLRTGSLWWASGAHLGWNWTHGFLLDLPVSGLDIADQPFIESRALGPPLLSGAGFGPEGSLLTTVVLVCAAAWTWWTHRLAPARWTQETPPLATLVTRPRTTEIRGAT